MFFPSIAHPENLSNRRLQLVNDEFSEHQTTCTTEGFVNLKNQYIDGRESEY
jgi:hypothetical protein